MQPQETGDIVGGLFSRIDQLFWSHWHDPTLYWIQRFKRLRPSRPMTPAAMAVVIALAAVRMLTSASRAISLTVSEHAPSGALCAASRITPNTANSLDVKHLAAHTGRSTPAGRFLTSRQNQSSRLTAEFR